MKQTILILALMSMLLGCTTAPPAVSDQEPVEAVPAFIVINEAASAGDYEFIELFAITPHPVIFSSGWTLIDNANNFSEGEKAFIIPEGTVIPAYGYLLICPFTEARAKDVLNDPDVPADALCDISFSLGSNDSVSLYYDALLVDSISWEHDVNSIGRVTDGLAQISDDLVPTPGMQNSIEPVARGSFPIRINEINSRGDDYVELYNSGDTPFSFTEGDWVIEDIKKDRDYEIPGSLEIPAEGYVLLRTGHDDFSVKFGSSDSVILRYKDRIFDSYRWGEHVNSHGRYPDGADQWGPMEMSPGEENLPVTAD
jgi:hypothetical protein